MVHGVSCNAMVLKSLALKFLCKNRVFLSAFVLGHRMWVAWCAKNRHIVAIGKWCQAIVRRVLWGRRTLHGAWTCFTAGLFSLVMQNVQFSFIPLWNASSFCHINRNTLRSCGGKGLGSSARHLNCRGTITCPTSENLFQVCWSCVSLNWGVCYNTFYPEDQICCIALCASGILRLKSITGWKCWSYSENKLDQTAVSCHSSFHFPGRQLFLMCLAITIFVPLKLHMVKWKMVLCPSSWRAPLRTSFETNLTNLTTFSKSSYILSSTCSSFRNTHQSLIQPVKVSPDLKRYPTDPTNLRSTVPANIPALIFMSSAAPLWTWMHTVLPDCAKSLQGKHPVVVRYRQPGPDVPAPLVPPSPFSPTCSFVPPLDKTEMVISQLLMKIKYWCLVYMKGLWKHFQNFIIWLLS